MKTKKYDSEYLKKHGLPWCDADYEKAIRNMLSDKEWTKWSDKRIADHIGATVKKVQKQRALLGQSRVLQAPSGHVYFAQGVDGGLVKIGFARCVNSRLKDLQIGSPVILQIVKIINHCDMEVERYLHKRFDQFRRHGEWFDPCVLREKLLNE